MHRRVGIFGGTFNPVHSGHLAFALTAKDMCQLDEVIFLPEPEPRMKNNVTSVDVRSKQLEEMLGNYPHLSVVTLDDKSFNIGKTLPRLRQLLQGASLTFLVGSDVALHLKDWDGIEQLIRNCDLAIGLRSQHSDSEVHRAMKKLQDDVDLQVRYELIKTAHAGKSSSDFK